MRLPSAISNREEENYINTVHCLVKDLHVKVTATTISRRLREHPDFPSLLSISDSLKAWKIENLAIRIAADKLPDLPLPFITKLRVNRKYSMCVVKEFNHHQVTVSEGTSSKWKKMPYDEFLQSWQGVVLLTESTGDSGEKEYKKIRTRENVNRALIVTAIALVLAVYGVNTGFSFYNIGLAAWPALSLLTLKLLGCLIGVLLLWFEMDEHNPALQKVCHLGRKLNCRAILTSKAAKIGSFLTWSDAGFIYFVGGFLTLNINGVQPSAVTLLSCITLLALPYSLFSIYYQWRVAKQWCILCLSVQAIFITEFIVSLSGGLYLTTLIENIPAKVILITIASFIIPAVAWLLLKPWILSAKENNTTKTSLARLKYNPQIFTSVLLHQKPMEHVATGLGIVLGNPAAKYKIIKVCNPYCKPCAAAHTTIDEILQTNNDVQVQIIFTATGNENDKKTIPARHLMAIAAKGDKHMVESALNDWYNAPDKDYEVFAQKYKMNGELQQQETRIREMSDWCNKTGIMFTPTFFVNGFQLPAMYKVADLKYLLEQ